MEPLCCANWSHTDTNIACSNHGTKACSQCLLVQYCSKECQTAHWPIHKVDCKSTVRKSTWRPAWEVERRPPHFIEKSNPGGPPAVTKYGGKKYLWGNVPALDLLQLKDNEGENNSRDISLLLAASGDLRNLIKTIGCLPHTYSGHVHVDINDEDEAVVARNLAILLLAFHFPPDMASVFMLHLWYSAFLPESMMQSIRNKVFPIIQKLLNSTADSTNILQGTWSCNNARLSAELSRQDWNRVLSYFSETSNLSFDDALALRTSVTLAHDRRDYRDRAFFRLPPSWRLAQLKFRRDGVLLAFGASHDSFNIPNPTFFENKSSWPMPDSADPLDGWKLTEILQASYTAKDDLYGQLYVHIRGTLLKFCHRLAALDVNICLFQMNALDLPDRIATLRDDEQFYDRIELANIADSGYLGPPRTLGLFGPLLKPKAQNPSATLLTLFLNATHEMSNEAYQVASAERSLKMTMQFLTINREMIRSRDRSNAELLNFVNAQDLFMDSEPLFNRFIESARLQEIGDFLGLAMKSQHTIVAKWPMRLKKKPTQHEFEMLYWSGHQGSERYVEWYRTG